MSSPRQAACIAALGARTPVGLSADAAASAARAGICRIMEHPYMVDRAGDPFRLAFDATLDEASKRTGRMLSLATSALEELLSRVRLSTSAKLSLHLGLPELSPFFSKADATSVCSRLQLAIPTLQVRPVTEGNAGGLVAMKHALAELASGETACCVVGGVDSFVDPDLLETLDEAQRIASPSTKWGFPPGEGAAMMLVCSPAFARSCGLQVLATVANVAVTHEPNKMGTETICLGAGLAAAMSQASSAATAPVTKQYCDIDGERYREHEFANAIMRLPPRAFANAVDYVAPVDVWGHTGAASGALLTMLPVAQHWRGFSPGRWPLVWCSAENGTRAALLLQLPQTRDRRFTRE